MARETETPGETQLRAGHHWKEADRVQDYVVQNEQHPDVMAEVFKLLTDMLPFEKEAPLRVLDIGSGTGVVAAAMLDVFPKAKAIGLDISEPMMQLGRERMTRFGDRFRYHEGDFADGLLPSDLAGPFDLTVSSRAIHHITPEAKQSLYTDILQHTASGGCFFNIDNMQPPDDFIRARYRQVPDLTAAPRPQPVPGAPRTASREHPDPMGDQLVWLRDAGWAHVDCYWKRLGRSMIGGFKVE